MMNDFESTDDIFRIRGGKCTVEFTAQFEAGIRSTSIQRSGVYDLNVCALTCLIHSDIADIIAVRCKNAKASVPFRDGELLSVLFIHVRDNFLAEDLRP